MKRFFALFLLFLTIWSTSGDLYAKKRRSKKRPRKQHYAKTYYKYQKNTEVEFDEAELDAQFHKPQGFHSYKAQDRDFDDMIEPRKNFNYELKHSVD